MTSHRIAAISYALETIECTCGVVLKAEPDAYEHDRHEPLVTAWGDHRASVGLPRRGPSSSSPGTGSPWVTPARP